MVPARYIFVFDDGQVFRTDDKPTMEDLEQAVVGIVTIVSLADQVYYGRAGKWLPIPNGGLGTAEVDGRQTRPFHALRSYFEDANGS